jgi:hypothetical protein
MSEKKWTLVRLGIEGIYPESAIARLKREKIPLYGIKKVQKNVLELCIERKNRKKVFTILNNSCYNIVYAKNYGLSRIPALCREKAGAIVGCALFGVLCALSGYPVLKIEVVGDGAYYREKVISLLAESGIAIGKGYDGKSAPEVTAKILSLDGVTFCSVKKAGSVLTVEVQVSPQATMPESGPLCSPAAGEIYALTVLRGEVQKAVGDGVEEGEIVVSAQGVVMASVRVLCKAQAEVMAERADGAYAEALLQIGAAQAEIQSHTEEKTKDGYTVTIEYILTASINM